MSTVPPPPDPRPITERIAAILEKISAFRENSLEARMRHREAIRAIVIKYRGQIVAVVLAFKTKLEQLRAANAPISEFEKAKADVKIQIIDLIHLMQDEIHDVPKVNLDQVKAHIQERKRDLEGLRNGPPWRT